MNQKTSLNFERSNALFRRALARIPGGSQTNSKRPYQFAAGGYPIYAAEGKGGRIVDVDGNEYIDLVQALGPVALGYQYEAVDAAVRAQMERGMIYGLLSPLEVECAELLCDVVPCAEMVRFFKGGGEATAAAARTVRGYTGRELILNAGYRGWPDVWAAEVDSTAVPRSLQASLEAFPKHDLAALTEKFAQHEGQVAAVFLDIQTQHPPAGYLQAVKELCHANGALLVYDEIVTGFRLALGGAQEYYGVTPDLACFAKAMANGMPLACVAGRADVMATMADRAISITYGGEALSLAAAIATIKELRDKQVNQRLWQVGRRLMDGLNDAAAEAEIPFHCGGIEPMTTMTFSSDGVHAQEVLWQYFLQEMAVRGVLMRRGGLNFVNYSHTNEEIDSVVAAASDVFSELKLIWGTDAVEEAVQERKGGNPYQIVT